jgi:hypothetical protein
MTSTICLQLIGSPVSTRTLIAAWSCESFFSAVAFGSRCFLAFASAGATSTFCALGFFAFGALAFVLVALAVFFVLVVFLVATCLSLFIWGFLFGVATIAMPVTDSCLGSTESSSGLREEFRMRPKILERRG